MTVLLRMTVGAVALLASASLAEAADPARGQELFALCQACHTLNGENGTGPTLKGVVGRQAGAVAGFRYSPAMRRANLVWDDANLERFLADPQDVIRGNRMPFDGVPSAQDRADIVAYLDQAAK
ncbi:c-type cytochrome [Falsiroseomonas sp. HW251]|uniref:c-type cytochrome n=1 Tax=Falsiroseomonas sp. HW251 TaxID=3390998 RepID=UPI003D31384A